MNKISTKIQKLKQNINKEVVWVMKDDSFINLNYFLSIESTFNEALNSYNLNKEKSPNVKKVLNNQLNNKIVKSNNKNSDNPENIQGRITKKIISRKNDSNIINGGNFNIEKYKINSNGNEEKKLKPIANINSIANQKKFDMLKPNKTLNNNITINNSNIQKKFGIVGIKSKSRKKSCNYDINKIKDSNPINNLYNNPPLVDINGNKENAINTKIKNDENSKTKSKPKIQNNSLVITKDKLNQYLYFSATPKKKSKENNNSGINLDNLILNAQSSSILNTSDCQSISTKRNDKLNITYNSIDTTFMQESNPEYKILSNNNNITNSGNIFSKKYISSLNPIDYEYDTFCQAIIKTGLCEEKMALSKYSENFPAPCGHELCSKLPAMEPQVLNFYQNNEKSDKINVKQEATSHLVFPLGIKICVEKDFHNQKLESEPLVNTIYNEKGDIYYIASMTIFRKITIKNYNKIFKINPIEIYNKLKKNTNSNNNFEEKNKSKNFNNSNRSFKYINNNNMNLNNKNDSINDSTKKNNIDINMKNKSFNSLNINAQNSSNNNELLNYNPNDVIYIPECISLVSRFPFFNQLSICLKTIINMRRQIVNGDNNQKIENEITEFINHIINQIPIASNKYNIIFYTPISIEPVKLYNPFIYNFENFTCLNIFSLLSIDNIITIFLLVLLEQKIIFVDISHLKLSAITFFFINLIYPLSWVNTYQPLLSLSTIRYIQSITPFIMGGNENLILYAYYKKYIIYNESMDNIDKSNILFVNLSNNLISCDCYNLISNKKGQNRKQILKYLNLPDLPKSIEKKLYNHLSDIEKIEDLKEMNEKIKTFFCRIMVFILDDYKDYFINSLGKPIFNKDNYLMNKSEDKKMFYKELLETQLFTQFIFNENELYKSRKTKEKKLKNKNINYGVLHDGNYKDESFFMKNKNKIDELKMMIKQKKKEKYRKTLKNAKNIVRSISSMFNRTLENKSIDKDKSFNKSNKKNKSTFKQKKKKRKIYNIMLMPYFIEELNIDLSESEKYDYIQNKLNSIMTIDNQLNQINNYKNKYIFDFNQKFELTSIKDDKTRYFIGTLLSENSSEKNNLNLTLNNRISYINGKNTTKTDPIKKNLFSRNNEDSPEKKYAKSKEKINLWFRNICLCSNKKKVSYEINIIDELKSELSRIFFAKLISQNYKTLFDIRENNQNFVNNECFFELLKKMQFILSTITYNEYNVGKLLTLSCFKYYTILEENKKTKIYLYNKYSELFTPSELWLNHIFWKTWFDEDITYVEKEMNLTNDYDYTAELNKSNNEENELFEYNEENDNLSIEYRLLVKISKVMNLLKLGDEFINKVIFDDLAKNYLTENEINVFKEQY